MLAALALGAVLLALSTPAAEVVEVIASRGGFRPATLSVHKGETLRLLISSADDEHCFAIDALRVEKRVVPGRATSVELTPEAAGTFPIHCCLESGAAAERERGRLVVGE